MILRGSWKPDRFLAMINRYVTGGEGSDVPKIDAPTGLAYLGAGYWRAVLWASPSSHLLDEPLSDLYGVSLVNPDRSWDETQAVELGVSILAQLEYKASR